MENLKAITLDPKKSVLFLVDYQAKMFWGAESHDKTYIKNNVMALAKGTAILGVPAVLTTISAKSNGDFLPEIVSMFPKNKIIDRKMPSFDALEDSEIFDALRKTKRKQVVVSGLWTSMCMTLTALRCLREGYEVFGVMDTTGSESLPAYNMAVKRMVQAGVVPVTWMQVVSEWMHDWKNPKAGELYSDFYSAYSGYFGQKAP
jgi:nicotinamidase-related amidase